MSLKTIQSTYRAPAAQVDLGTSFGPERTALLESHLPQVKFIAERIAAKLPPGVESADLYGAGVLGLLDAVAKFDPTRGVMFKTYAELRVRGAILDSLRGLDWAPRSLRRRGREVEAAYADIERERGRPAEEREVAARLGISLSALQSLLGELRNLTVTGLEQTDEYDETRTRNIPQDKEETPLARYERSETSTLLASAVDQLPERERQVVALYYVEELTMKEIGLVLGVTESRVSQLRTQAILRLRGKLTHLKRDLLRD